MRPIAANIRGLTLAIAVLFLLTSLGVGYWSLVAASELAADPFDLDRLVGRVASISWIASAPEAARVSVEASIRQLATSPGPFAVELRTNLCMCVRR